MDATEPLPQATQAAVPSGTVTFLFTDIEGSTRLLEQLREQYATVLADQRELLRAAFAQHNGHEIDTQGDAFFVAFPRALEAVACAVAAQRALAAHRWPQGVAVRVRMGLHTGEPTLGRMGYVGLDVHRAARIAGAGHGGQVLLSQTTRDLIYQDLPAGLALRPLGEHQLKDIRFPQALYQLDVDGLPVKFPPLKTGLAAGTPPTQGEPQSDASVLVGAAVTDWPAPEGGNVPRHNLPPQPTPFFGRSDELGSIQTLISDPSCRLLTFVGPGGIGKTRLALQTATNSLASFADGTYFVALASINSPDLIVSTILEVLKLPRLESLDLKLHLFRSLHSKAILLILDSFEHLTAGATLISELLTAAPGVKILVTSRERLNLAEELVFEIEGLNYPATNVTAGLESYSAVQLFLRGARRVDTKFTLQEADRSAIGRICQLVKGMPLGLELAATWTRTFSCQQIAEEIERDPDFLASSLRNVPERHRSLRNVFDRSWTLLTPDEQLAFQRLSIFRGKFHRSAAEAVSGTSLLGLSALVDKSLLHVNGSGAYEIHELLRQYAHEKLTDSGELQQTCDRHLLYFATLAEEAEPQLRSIEQEAWRVRVENEHHNLRTALDWCKNGQGDVTAGLRLACALWLFWRNSGYAGEGVDYLDHLLARSANGPAAARAWALAIEAFLLLYLGKLDRAKTLAEASLLLLQESGEPGPQRAEVLALNVLGSLARVNRDDKTARDYHQRAKELSRATGDQWLVGLTINNQGLDDFFQHDYEGANVLFEESLVLYRQIASPDTITLYNCLTRIARRQERFGKAIHYVEAALELSRQRRDTVNLVLTLSSLAGICSAMGQAQRAVQLFGAAESLQTGISTRLPMSLREDTEATFEVARKDLDEATFDRIWAEGYAMSLEQTIACAQQTLSGLMTRSHPAQAAASGEAKGAQLFPGDELTSRELEVLQLLSTGMTNQDIAGKLVITEGTVKRHTHNIFAKLGVQNRTQALLRARELALL